MPREDLHECVIRLIEQMTGQEPPFPPSEEAKRIGIALTKGDFALSQFNELMLMLGYDRVNEGFFAFLTADGEPSPEALEQDYPRFKSLEHLEQAVIKFRKFALLLFGNTKYAFRALSRDEDYLRRWLETVSERVDPRDYRNRNDPVSTIARIPADETYYLGYVIENQLKESLAETPDDPELRAQMHKMERIREIGRRNNLSYLLSGHLDVYVATSMRLPHEYSFISSFTNSLFDHDLLKTMKLRWFDPTQAYCENRIDKGLVEALMLKRAQCTLYLAQESDTFGKDSELASTLAQGKPVVAYVPQGNTDYFRKLLGSQFKSSPESSIEEFYKQQLMVFAPQAAWEDRGIQAWMHDGEIDAIGLDRVEAILLEAMRDRYDKRADILRRIHPLSIQVNLSTGVANGVLVIRNLDDCAELLRRILTQSMEFEIESKDCEDGEEYLFLREKISGCVFRVMTGDRILTNCFWNYYLEEE